MLLATPSLFITPSVAAAGSVDACNCAVAGDVPEGLRGGQRSSYFTKGQAGLGF